MKWSKFKSQYLIKGKKYDWDSTANVQCVDLPKVMLEKVCGVPTTKGKAIWGNACDWWNIPAPLIPYVFKIPNTPDFVPIETDIAIWGKNYSASHNCGHIAIATGEGNISAFKVWEQNRTGKNDGVALNSQTYYKDFKGVLRFYRYIKSAVNIRDLPSVNGRLLGELPKGQKIKIYEKKGNWVRISSDKQQWISYNYVKELGD